MISNAFELPEPADEAPRTERTPAWQLRRLNRIAAALWEARPLIGNDALIAISVTPDMAGTQIDFHVHQPAEREVAQQLAERLGWDPEADVRQVGAGRHHLWHGMLGGFRAYAVWIEQPAADAERLPALARAGAGALAGPIDKAAILRQPAIDSLLHSGVHPSDGPGQ